MIIPTIYTPLTKKLAVLDVTQGGRCGAQYMDFIRCASVVGRYRADYDCYKELADFRECTINDKQIKRCRIMEQERKRQNRPPIEALGKDIPEKYHI
uniref:Uncharacterized protein n=1 Tax=Arion vulgaris TaxID=1028688 RepID=A0A0B7AGB1_9EUPU